MKKAVLIGAIMTAAQVVMAFPSWMGVYGDYQRHDGGNPGTFTVLMNQDYNGLHAGVGIQIDGGEWEFYPMEHAGNMDGNSIWQLTPDFSFPGGATVTYFFQGWDDWGGVMWDSDNANNYSFTATGGGQGVIQWDQGTDHPVANYTTLADGTIHAIWADYEAGELKITRRALPDGEWTAWQTVMNGQYFNAPKIAVADASIVITYNDAGINKLIRSTDDGATFSVPMDLGLSGSVLALRAESATEFQILNAYDSSGYKLDFLKSTDGGATWGAPVQLASFPASTAYAGLTARMSANSEAIFVAYAYDVVDGRAFGEGTQYVASSSDGITWSTEELQSYSITRGNGASLSLLVTDADAFVGSSKGPGPFGGAGSARVWKQTGTSWTVRELSDYSSSNPTYLTQTPDGSIVFVDGGTFGYGSVYAVSTDNGDSFGSVRDLPMPEGIDNVSGIAAVHASAFGAHLIWQGFISEPEYTSVMSWQTGVSGSVEPLQWVGNTYNWPFEGEINPGDPLWINVESYPAGAGTSALVVYSADGGQNWQAADMEWAGTQGQNDWWHINLSWLTTAGATIEYAVLVSDGQTGIWDSNGGLNYKAHVNGGFDGPVQWVGNTYTWPFGGDWDIGEDLWVNADTWPMNTAVRVSVVYSINGGNWEAAAMNIGDPENNNDHWYLNMGSHPSGTHIQFAIMAEDIYGNVLWDSNSGDDYHATVN